MDRSPEFVVALGLAMAERHRRHPSDRAADYESVAVDAAHEALSARCAPSTVVWRRLATARRAARLRQTVAIPAGLPAPGPPPWAAVDAAEAIEHALSGLSPESAALVRLAGEGYTQAEIAARVGRSQAWVSGRLARATAALRPVEVA